MADAADSRPAVDYPRHPLVVFLAEGEIGDQSCSGARPANLKRTTPGVQHHILWVLRHEFDWIGRRIPGKPAQRQLKSLGIDSITIILGKGARRVATAVRSARTIAIVADAVRTLILVKRCVLHGWAPTYDEAIDAERWLQSICVIPFNADRRD